MENASNPFGDVTKMMEQFKVPGVDIPAIVEARRKDIEALVDANQSAREAMQALARRQTEMATQAMQDIQEAAKRAAGGIGGVVDPVRQAELTGKALGKALADMKELAEMARDAQADTMAHLTQRAREHTQEIKNLMQRK